MKISTKLTLVQRNYKSGWLDDMECLYYNDESEENRNAEKQGAKRERWLFASRGGNPDRSVSCVLAVIRMEDKM